jgi:aconitate hydratase
MQQGARREVKLDLRRSINEKGQVAVEQGVIVGCSGGMYENISEAVISSPANPSVMGIFAVGLPGRRAHRPCHDEGRHIATLMETGALIKSAFCGPCFGAGDTPANNTCPSVTPREILPTARAQNQETDRSPPSRS